MELLTWLHTPIEPTRLRRAFCGIFIATLATIFYWNNLHLQLWNDEVFSLIHFQRVPLLTTLTDYPETNNHVLFNFFQNLWIRAIGNPSVKDLLSEPWKLRILPLACAVTTCIALFFGLLRRFGPGPALLGLALLAFSIPYYNFALQSRSYSMLMMLGTLQFFSFVGYLESGGRRHLWAGALWAFMLFYAHPAGLYLIVGWCLAAVAVYSGDLRRSELRRQRAYYAAGAWICGLFLAGLAYLPIIHAILHNPWLSSHSVSLGGFLHDTVFSVLRQLAGTQLYLFVLLGALVLGSGFLRSAPLERRMLLFCVLVIPGTYLLPLLRLDPAPQRTFTILIPYFAIGGAVALAGALRCYPATPGLAYAAPLLVVVLAFRFASGLERRNRAIEQGIRYGVELGSIETAYYLHRFNPLDAVRDARYYQDHERLPVYAAIAYRQELPHYLEAFGIPWREYRSPAQQAALPQRAIIISSLLPEFRRRYARLLDYRVADSSGGFYEVLQVQKR